MNNLFKLISLIYLIILSSILLIPLDFFLTTQIVEDRHQPSNNESYIIHLFLFFILYFLLNFAFQNKIKVLFFCIIYSIIIEILQILTSRGFQLGDILFNLIGIVLSYLFFYFLKRIHKNTN